MYRHGPLTRVIRFFSGPIRVAIPKKFAEAPILRLWRCDGPFGKYPRGCSDCLHGKYAARDGGKSRYICSRLGYAVNEKWCDGFELREG